MERHGGDAYLLMCGIFGTICSTYLLIRPMAPPLAGGRKELEASLLGRPVPQSMRKYPLQSTVQSRQKIPLLSADVMLSRSRTGNRHER